MEKPLFEKFKKDFVEKVKQLKVGNPFDAETNLGALVSKPHLEKVESYIKLAEKEGGKILCGGNRVSVKNFENGYYLEPTVIEVFDDQCRVNQEEIFGPVLAVVKAESFDAALEIVNSSEYGLTGSVYSNNRSVLERARYDFEVGNLYLNRKCTGAMMGVHPFGGLKLSGTNTKSGGPDYLQNFMEAKAVGEKL